LKENEMKKLAIILGIRPDIIRASLILRRLVKDESFETKFIWSGQHYSDNLKDVFFRELSVPSPDIELDARGQTDAEISAEVIAKLYPVLEELQPEATVFLGDTNTVMGCLAAAQLNIPIVHIEGCMRSYDWRMPEEKYRTTIDHLSDVIYAYFDEYKNQGIAEGINPQNIVVVQNPIVDVLKEFYYKKKKYYDSIADEAFFRTRKIQKAQYFLMTCHRRENVHSTVAFGNIWDLLKKTDRTVYFPASYRTQRVLKESGLKPPENVIMVDPVGYEEMLVLMTGARGVITDSGTVVEEACVLQVPSVQMRTSTERPQVYDVKASVKFDPANIENSSPAEVFEKIELIYGTKWENPLGDGRASERIADDLVARLKQGAFRRHGPSDYHLDIGRSYQGDNLSIEKR
jgi:UDP-N-acetylglucosamine 2-epimerase